MGDLPGGPCLAQVNRQRGAALLESLAEPSALRSRQAYGRLMHLPKAVRLKTLRLMVPEDVSELDKTQRYLHGKAFRILAKQQGRQRRNSVSHEKGLRRKTWRCGRGKGGREISNEWLEDEIFEAQEFRCEDEVDAVRWREAQELARTVARGYTQVRCRLDRRLAEAMKQLNRERFDEVRRSFLKQHGTEILSSLEHKACMKVQRLTCAPLAEDVRLEFLKTLGHGRLRPTLHGTAVKNHSSIFERGLLVPGQGNGIHVAHGSAHGLGVYSASLENPSLALGFVKGAKCVLVCGVVDDAGYTPQVQTYGIRRCWRESSNIRVVDDAVIALNASHIAPFFSLEYHPKAHSEMPPKPKPPVNLRKMLQPLKAVNFFRHLYQILLPTPYLNRPGQVRRARFLWDTVKHHSSKWLKAHGFWTAHASKAF